VGGSLEGLVCFHVREEQDRKIAFVAEILALRGVPVTTDALLGGLVERARREDVELVAALTLERTERDKALARRGFLRSWGTFTVGCVPLAVEPESLRDPSRWSLEAGSFDVV
jgi:hypothetical protein